MILFLNIFMLGSLLRPVLKPITRLFLGFIAVPIFRILMRKVVRAQEINEELEQDLELWFRGSLLLLAATANMEDALFGSFFSEATRGGTFFMAGRLLLAIGVIEGMPDQSLFALIHPGPQKPKIEKGHVVRSIIQYIPKLTKGLVCQHLNRSSPVLAILSVLEEGQVGWICYGLAISQYLLIGLVASKDKALDVLSQFDDAVAVQRHEIEEQLEHQQASRRLAESKMKSMDSNLDSL